LKHPKSLAETPVTENETQWIYSFVFLIV